MKIPKKGDLSACGNCTGFTLLSIPGKAFNGVILQRKKIRSRLISGASEANLDFQLSTQGSSHKMDIKDQK